MVIRGKDIDLHRCTVVIFFSFVGRGVVTMLLVKLDAYIGQSLRAKMNPDVVLLALRSNLELTCVVSGRMPGWKGC